MWEHSNVGALQCGPRPPDPRPQMPKPPASPESARGISLPKVVVSCAREATCGKWNCFGRTPETILSEQVGVSCTREATF